MRTLLASFVAVAVTASACSVQAAAPAFKKLTLSDQFYAEGAYYGDFNKDGKLDVVAGPFWYEGPDFQKKHEVREPKTFDPKGYSDNFLTFTADFNGDGWTRHLLRALPRQGRLLVREPRRQGRATGSRTWRSRWSTTNRRCGATSTATAGRTWCSTRAASWATPPGIPPSRTSRGCSTPSRPSGTTTSTPTASASATSTATAAWTSWNPAAGGNSRPTPQPDQPWIEHPFQFAAAAAQMFAYDVDGDGLNDVITAWHCHQYGLVWYKQVEEREGRDHLEEERDPAGQART